MPHLADKSDVSFEARSQQIISYQITDTYNKAGIRTITNADGVETKESVTITETEIRRPAFSNFLLGTGYNAATSAAFSAVGSNFFKAPQGAAANEAAIGGYDRWYPKSIDDQP